VATLQLTHHKICAAYSFDLFRHTTTHCDGCNVKSRSVKIYHLAITVIWIRPWNAVEDMTWNNLKRFHWIDLRTTCTPVIHLCGAASGQHRTSKYLVILNCLEKCGRSYNLCTAPTRNATKDRHRIKGRVLTP